MQSVNFQPQISSVRKKISAQSFSSRSQKHTSQHHVCRRAFQLSSQQTTDLLSAHGRRNTSDINRHFNTRHKQLILSLMVSPLYNDRKVCCSLFEAAYRIFTTGKKCLIIRLFSACVMGLMMIDLINVSVETIMLQLNS